MRSQGSFEKQQAVPLLNERQEKKRLRPLLLQATGFACSHPALSFGIASNDHRRREE